MWEKILTKETLAKMVLLHPDVSEDYETMNSFTNFLVNNVDYKAVVVMATQWDSYTDVKQVNLAITIVGEYHASRFILLLDYLNERFKNGELK